MTYGAANLQEFIEMVEAREAAAWARVAATGKPVTLRITGGTYEVFTTDGHYRIEREIDPETETPTGWWRVLEIVEGFGIETDIYRRTLRDAKAAIGA